MKRLMALAVLILAGCQGSGLQSSSYEWPSRDALITQQCLQAGHTVGTLALRGCREEVIAGRSPTPPTQPPAVALASLSGFGPERDQLLALWAEQNQACRGTAGANHAFTYCDDRSVTGRRLEELGMCYGREGEAGYQLTWHFCGPTSIRMASAPATPLAPPTYTPQYSSSSTQPSYSTGGSTGSGYGGSCACPNDRDSAGRRCGARSAWSRAGGASPSCGIIPTVTPSYSGGGGGTVHVRGYYRRDGTYVRPHTRRR